MSEGVSLDFDATVVMDAGDPDAAADEAARRLMELPYPILAVVAGAETGVEAADRLAERLSLRRNKLHKSAARRNKYLMHEACRDAGVRAAGQCLATSWAEVETFLAGWTPKPFLAVVKPIDSAGSDDVYKCTSPAEVKTAFDVIYGKVRGVAVGC